MPAVFIGFCISFLPIVIFLVVVTLNVNSMIVFIGCLGKLEFRFGRSNKNP